MKVINLYGGPGSGKSSSAAGLFSAMKMQHLSVELVTEYAKDLVYSDRTNVMDDQQEYIFTKQNQRLHILRDKVDYVITDSPLLLSLIYVNQDWCCADAFKSLVSCMYDSYDNINIYLHRPEQYQPYGRRHTSNEAITIDKAVWSMLSSNNVPFYDIPTNSDTFQQLLGIVNKNT